MSLVVTSTINLGGQPVNGVAVDIDGDGDLDLVVVNFNNDNATILLNNGAGVFTAAGTSPLANGGDNVFGIAAADFNRDGKQDLVLTTQSNGGARVYLGDGAAGFTATAGSPISLTGTMTAVAVGDFNKDGKPDFVALDGNNNLAHVELGDGAGGFSAGAGSPKSTQGGPSDVVVGDINRDGNLDFAIASQSGTVSWFAGNGSGGFAAEAVLATLGSSPRGLALGDLDGDGDLDMVVTKNLADQVAVLLLDGAGGVTSTTNFAVGTRPIGIELVDLNGDGKLDMAVADNTADTLAIRLGDGAGGFGALTTVATGIDPRDVIIGDFNGDGYKDVAVVNQNASGSPGTLSIMLDTGLSIRASESSFVEGNGGVHAVTYTVTRNGSAGGAVSVDWAVGGSASASDFQGGVLPSGTLNFANNETSKTITVSVLGDTTPEGNEGFSVTLSNPTGIDIFTASAGTTIQDDDTPAGMGTEGSDFAQLSEGSNAYSAGGGADEVYGNGGDDTLQGNAGADIVNGGDGDDLLYGGKDNDRVEGGSGADRMFGDLGNDTVLAGAGDDTVEGGDGDDQLGGGAGADVMQGSAGNDTLQGDDGADTLRGGQGDDVVQGGAGNDWLSGDRGNDTLTGGAGADTFHAFAGGGADRVTDFSLAQGDHVQLLPGATYTASQVGADTVVSLGDGASLTLVGVQLSSLTTGWIS